MRRLMAREWLTFSFSSSKRVDRLRRGGGFSLDSFAATADGCTP